SAQAVFVACRAGIPRGFMTLRGDGCLDLAYVLPEARGTGTASALLGTLEAHATAAGQRRLTTRASDMARSFFLRHGWRVAGPAPQRRAGLVLPATDMVRHLPPV
ncbi:MAG: GNAT family N-acetyltransferase, partial [Jannaschia sp.]